ncbi:histidine kinase [Candidatus Poribacteria bacterium]|nr:histidine kinase [Candidatus Poribacteria bacterium]
MANKDQMEEVAVTVRSTGMPTNQKKNVHEGRGLRPTSRSATEEYYRRLRRNLQAAILTAFMVPLAIMSLYFHMQFNFTLKESGKLHLTTLAESQRNTIDLFLQERVVNIFNLFHRYDFTLEPTPDNMRRNLERLLEMSDAFVDVGFLEGSGVQIGYAGPYAYLQGKDYSGETWFRTLIDHDQNYHISDIYLGFRQKPHFTIAVKQIFDGNPYVMRATLDPDKFYLFLRTIGRGKGANSTLINKEGKYQVVDPDRGRVLDSSDYMPPREAVSGANEVKTNGDAELMAYAWLKEVPWVLVVNQPLRIAYAQMYRARRILIAATFALVIVMSAAVWLITNKLLRRAEETDLSRKELRSQLLHAAKLVSVGELAGGVAHEINNPLAIISAESGVIRDMLDPQFGMDCSPEKIRKELDHIDTAVFRARDITQKLLSIVRKNEPRLTSCSVNRLLEDVVSGLMEKEFSVSGIQLFRDFDPHVPEIMLDADQMRQVFLNIVNNARDALEGSGAITLGTSHDDKLVRVKITDTGKGMTSEQMEKIFLPFYSTKDVGKGTGLGLSISLSIVQAVGGRIEVQSMPGAGSSFTIVLPRNQTEESANV